MMYGLAVVLCPSLSLDNGTVTYNDNTLGLNTVATYSCNTGYTLTSGSNARTCGSDGVWSGSAPICEGSWYIASLYRLFFS